MLLARASQIRHPFLAYAGPLSATGYEGHDEMILWWYTGQHAETNTLVEGQTFVRISLGQDAGLQPYLQVCRLPFAIWKQFFQPQLPGSQPSRREWGVLASLLCLHTTEQRFFAHPQRFPHLMTNASKHVAQSIAFTFQGHTHPSSNSIHMGRFGGSFKSQSDIQRPTTMERHKVMGYKRKHLTNTCYIHLHKIRIMSVVFQNYKEWMLQISF